MNAPEEGRQGIVLGRDSFREEVRIRVTGGVSGNGIPYPDTISRYHILNVWDVIASVDCLQCFCYVLCVSRCRLGGIECTIPGTQLLPYSYNAPCPPHSVYPPPPHRPGSRLSVPASSADRTCSSVPNANQPSPMETARPSPMGTAQPSPMGTVTTRLMRMRMTSA